MQVAPDSPEQKKDFSLEAAKLADVVKHLQGCKLDDMVRRHDDHYEDQWTTQIYP